MQYGPPAHRSSRGDGSPLPWEEALLTEVQNTRFGVLLVNVQDGQVAFIEKVIRRRIEVLKVKAGASRQRKAKK